MPYEYGTPEYYKQIQEANPFAVATTPTPIDNYVAGDLTKEAELTSGEEQLAGSYVQTPRTQQQIRSEILSGMQQEIDSLKNQIQ